MLALSNLPDSGSQKNTKILKPWWNKLNDYLVILLLAVPIFVGGMELALGKFTCLPVVDCSFSKNGTLLSEIKYRNTCSVFYSSRKSTDVDGKTTTVIIELKKLPEYDYVNSECSKSSVDWFHSYFTSFFFGQAFILLVINNLWLKFPSTASFVNSFYGLVAECYNLPIGGVRSAKSSVPTNNQQDPEQAQEKGRRPSVSNVNEPLLSAIALESRQAKEQPLAARDTSSDISSDKQHETSVDLATAVVAIALCEKIRRFNDYVQASQRIQKLYLIQAVFQAVLTATFFTIDLMLKDDLKETIKCSINEGFPVVFDYFTCSHNLAVVLEIALVLFLIPLGLMFGLCVGSVVWTIPKVNFRKKNLMYRFQNELKNWDMPGDLLQHEASAKADMGFLLHLLHAYNELYAVQFAMYMSEGQYKNFKTVVLNSDWPMEYLEKFVFEGDNSIKTIVLKELSGIPNSLFKFMLTVPTGFCWIILEDSSPPQEDDFCRFSKFDTLTKLSIIKCGLTAVPKGLFKLKHLSYLSLKDNSIMHIENGISRLENLDVFDISYNNLKTIHESISILPLQQVDICYNPNIKTSAIQNVLACKKLEILYIVKSDQNKIFRRLNSNEEVAYRFNIVAKTYDQVEQVNM